MNSSVDDGMLIAAPGSGGIYRSPICVSTSATPKQRADAKARATAAPVIGTTPICKAHSCCADRPLQGRWARRTEACASLVVGWFGGFIPDPSQHCAMSCPFRKFHPTWIRIGLSPGHRRRLTGEGHPLFGLELVFGFCVNALPLFFGFSGQR